MPGNFNLQKGEARTTNSLELYRIIQKTLSHRVPGSPELVCSQASLFSSSDLTTSYRTALHIPSLLLLLFLPQLARVDFRRSKTILPNWEWGRVELRLCFLAYLLEIFPLFIFFFFFGGEGEHFFSSQKRPLNLPTADIPNYLTFYIKLPRKTYILKRKKGGKILCPITTFTKKKKQKTLHPLVHVERHCATDFPNTTRIHSGATFKFFLKWILQSKVTGFPLYSCSNLEGFCFFSHTPRR